MNNQRFLAATRTVLELGEHFDSLKTRALEIFEPATVAARGYVTPSKESQIRHLQLSYWKARLALYELVDETRREVTQLDQATPQKFLVCLAAAALLVDAARFLRENFHRATVVRRKLDEPDPVYGIPPRMYDDIQKSLTSPYHAWHLWQATRYYDRHRSELLRAAQASGIEPVIAIIERLRERLRPSLWTYLRTRVHVRGRRALRHIGRDVLERATYALQTLAGCGLAEIHVRPGHIPSLPLAIRAELARLLQPGDVLVVRKEFAVTNYFLPGHWPHVALYLGTSDDLRRLGIADDPRVRPRLKQLDDATPSTAVMAPDSANAWAGGPQHPCVLESMKDGVRIRSVNSPFCCDSVVVIRPLIEPRFLNVVLPRALQHEGKPYDFDFDFCTSYKLVCTEVVYRAYEGVAGLQFDLRRHAGRFALASGELLRMAVARRNFEVVAAYAPTHTPRVILGDAAATVVKQFERFET